MAIYKESRPYRSMKFKTKADRIRKVWALEHIILRRERRVMALIVLLFLLALTACGGADDGDFTAQAPNEKPPMASPVNVAISNTVLVEKGPPGATELGGELSAPESNPPESSTEGKLEPAGSLEEDAESLPPINIITPPSPLGLCVGVSCWDERQTCNPDTGICECPTPLVACPKADWYCVDLNSSLTFCGSCEELKTCNSCVDGICD